ncbi:MAG: hypothetical protein IJD97_05780 [Clostridia bacterium]|nr:hypothetical protein [Clostridia bacterium]
MNFKESYKKANDEIKGDRALLDKILNTPVKEKTKITPFVYKFASCAAAIILVGAVILMPEIKEKFVSENENTVAEECTVEEAKYSILADTAEVTEEATDGHISEKAEETETTITFKAVRKEENSKEVSESETYATGTVAMGAISEDNQDTEAVNGAAGVFSVEEAADEELKVAENYDSVMEAAEEAAPKTKIASGGGGGGAPATRSMTARTATKTTAEEKSASEIIALIGINEESLVPSGMTLTSSEVTYTEFSPEGNITAYEINMVYEKEGAKIILRLTDSATPLALDVAGHSGMVSASKTFGNTDIFITAYNFTLEDVENYLNGIN